MSKSLAEFAPYDSGPGANSTEDRWRQFARHFRGDGIIRTEGNEFELFADSTGMHVKVRPGECWIRGQWGLNTAQETLPVESNTSGVLRKDLVVLRNDFVANRIELDVLTGTPGSVQYPPLTQDASKWEIQVGLVDVPTGAVTIAASAVQWVPMYVDASARYKIMATNKPLIPNTSDTLVAFRELQTRSSYVTKLNDEGTRFRLERGGQWMMQYQVLWQVNGNGDRGIWLTREADPGNRFAYDQRRACIASTVNTLVALDRFNAGDVIRPWAWENAGAGPGLNIEGTYSMTCLAFWWLGP